jgi:VanZ family protein
MTLTRVWWIVGFVLIGVVVYVCLLPGGELPTTPFNDKLNHFLAHFALAAWFAGLVPRGRWWKILLGLALLGVGIEIAQGLMHEGREAEWRDAVANVCGALAGLGASRLGLARWPEVPARLLGRWRGKVA